MLRFWTLEIVLSLWWHDVWLTVRRINKFTGSLSGLFREMIRWEHFAMCTLTTKNRLNKVWCCKVISLFKQDSQIVPVLYVEHLGQHTGANVLAFNALKNYVFRPVTIEAVHDLSCLPPKLNYFWQRIRAALGSKNVLWSRPSRISAVTQEAPILQVVFYYFKGHSGFLCAKFTKHSEGWIPRIFVSKKHNCNDPKSTR